MKIAVDYDISTIFRDYIYVNGVSPKMCECGLDKMTPAYPSNKLPVGFHYIDVECGGIVTDKKNNAFNWYWEFSGCDDRCEV